MNSREVGSSLVVATGGLYELEQVTSTLSVFLYILISDTKRPQGDFLILTLNKMLQYEISELMRYLYLDYKTAKY